MLGFDHVLLLVDKGQERDTVVCERGLGLANRVRAVGRNTVVSVALNRVVRAYLPCRLSLRRIKLFRIGAELVLIRTVCQVLFHQVVTAVHHKG